MPEQAAAHARVHSGRSERRSVSFEGSHTRCAEEKILGPGKGEKMLMAGGFVHCRQRKPAAVPPAKGEAESPSANAAWLPPEFLESPQIRRTPPRHHGVQRGRGSLSLVNKESLTLAVKRSGAPYVGTTDRARRGVQFAQAHVGMLLLSRAKPLFCFFALLTAPLSFPIVLLGC